MKELSINETQEVQGGIVALFWIGYGAYRAYRTYRLVRTIAQAGTVGAVIGGLKESNGE